MFNGIRNLYVKLPKTLKECFYLMLQNNVVLRHHVVKAEKGKKSPRTFDELFVNYQKQRFY